MNSNRAYDGTLRHGKSKIHVQVGRQSKETAPLYIADVGPEILSWAFDLEGKFLGLRRYSGSHNEDLVRRFNQDERWAACTPNMSANENPDYKNMANAYIKAGFEIGKKILHDLSRKKVEFARPFSGILDSDDLMPLEKMMSDPETLDILKKISANLKTISITNTEVTPLGVAYYKIGYNR